MLEKYHKKLEDMSYDELLLKVCGSKKEYERVKRELEPINQKIYKWGRSMSKA